MPTTRIMFRAIAAAASLALLLSIGTVSAGTAATADERAAAFGKYNVKLKDSNTLVANGVAWKWRRKIVLIQRKPKNGGAWKTARSVRTTRYGKFWTTLEAGRHIPCAGTTKYMTRAKKKGTNSYKVDRRPDGRIAVWSC